MRNKRIAAKIEAALQRHNAKLSGTDLTPERKPVQRAENVQAIVDRRIAGERNWTLHEIAANEALSYKTVYRALKGKPGWLDYGTIRVTETLYRSWLTAVALGVSLDE